MVQPLNTGVKSWKSFLTSTALIGLIVLAPVAILFLAAVEIYDLLDDATNFAELTLPFPAIVNGAVFVALGVLAVFALCFATGLLLMTGPGKKIADFINKGITDKVPLLGLMRKLTLSLEVAASRSGQCCLFPLIPDWAMLTKTWMGLTT